MRPEARIHRAFTFWTILRRPWHSEVTELRGVDEALDGDHNMARIDTIGLDIAKDVFQVHGIDKSGKVLVRKTLRRANVEEYFRGIKPCLVGIEATSTANSWARIIQRAGHEVRLMHVTYVKPYVKTNKSDARDAEAICEAVRRPTMRFVPIKSEKQQTAILIHRAREALVRHKKSLALFLRAQLAEFGVVAPRGSMGAKAAQDSVKSQKLGRTPSSVRDVLAQIVDELRALSVRIKTLDSAILSGHKLDPQSRRIASIPNIGPITASAIRSIVGDIRQFRTGREFSAWIGLVPRQYSSGGKTRLGHITRGGNHYLRKLMYLAGNATISDPETVKTSVGRWARTLWRRKPRLVVAIAVASKLARVIFAMLRDERDYIAQPNRARDLAAS
jgi:transposase